MKIFEKNESAFFRDLAVFILAVFLIWQKASAASYDYYVDDGYSGSEEGTSEKPFEKISSAISAAKNGEKIFVRNGQYGEKVIIKKGVSLYGENKSKVILEGGVEIKDGASINNLTVEGGDPAVLAVSGSSVRIENCDIKKFGKIGINASSGNGKITVRKSSIYGGEGKGMYIELGRGIDISESNVYGNGEEGIDVRAKVSGTIKANNIYSNGEGGIEIIIGSSNVVISDNFIQKNGASGIAAQFYEETGKIGKVEIKNNKLAGNKKYGLDCALPSGGKPTASYWRSSIIFLDNKLEGNGITPINSFCKVIEASSEAKEEAGIQTDEETAQKEQEALEEQQVRRDEAAWEKAQLAEGYQKEAEERVKSRMQKINSEGKIKVFFRGIDFESLGAIKKEVEQNDILIAEIKKDLEQLSSEEVKQKMRNLADNLENNSSGWKSFVREKEMQKGVWKSFLIFLKLS